LKKHHLPQQKHKNELKGVAFIPAFNQNFLTPLYDFMMKWAARESTFKPKLVEQARIEKGQRVLDLGCGTATLSIQIKKTVPEAAVVGLDADPKILDIARSKARSADVQITLDYGTSFDLPYPNKFFDRVVASMLLHHLAPEDKIRTLKEVYRILKTEGELHIADFGRPHNAFMKLPSYVIRHLEQTADLVNGILRNMLLSVGFEQVEETAKFMTVFGTFTLYRATKPK